MGSVVSKVTKAIVGGVGKIIHKGLDLVGDVAGSVGLDSVEKELGGWGDDFEQVTSVLSGEYHYRAKELEAKQEQIEERVAIYNTRVEELQDKLSSLIAFAEIFKMAASNKLDAYVGKYGPEIDKAIEDLKKMTEQLQKDYDFVLGLAEGSFLEKLVGGALMIVGGLMSDIGDLVSGRANGATWKRVLSTAVQVVVIVVLVLYGQPGLATQMMIAAMAINLAISLDMAYANGAITGAVFSILDYVFNDLMNLDDLIGKDFNKFDNDSEDFKEMVSYVQLGLALSSLYLAWQNSTVMSAAFSKAGTAASEYIGISTSTTLGGLSLKTYSEIYSWYSRAMAVNDLVEANKANDEMKSKLDSDMSKLNEAILTKERKNFMKSYKDTAYFLQDQQEFIDRYVWSMTAQNMYVDPYGTTPVANIRFEPDSDTRMMSFGYEDVFDQSRAAGSKGYFNSIIYGG